MPMNIRKEANDRILVRNDGAGDGFHTAASTQAHKWMTHPRVPKLMNHNTPDPMKKTNAKRILP